MRTHWRGEDLIPYLDGRLSPGERARLDEHLAECAACRAQLEETRALMGVLDEWRAVEPSPGFDASLRARLEEEKARGKRWFMLRPAYAGALVLAVLLVVGVMLLQRQPQRLTESSSPETTAPAQVAQAPYEDEGSAGLENSVLLENYELLEEFDVLFEPLSNGEKEL